MTKEQVLNQIDFEVQEMKNVRAVVDDTSTVTGLFPNILNRIEFPIENRKALYRPDLNKVIALMSTNYTVLTHTRAVETIFQALDGQRIQYEPNKLELMSDGNRMFLHLRHPEIYKIGDLGDKVQMETIVTNSFDGSLSFGIELGGERLVCSNGMRAYKQDLVMRRKHYVFEPKLLIAEFINHFSKFRKEVIPFFENCLTVKLKVKDGNDLVLNLDIAQKYKKQVLQLWKKDDEGTGRNLWTWYNCMTKVATHSTDRYMVQRYLQEAAFKVSQSFVK
jgi:hypothetical protein